MAGILFIISAPSGSGKSTLVNQLRSMAADLDFSISYTTRHPRGSETDGREYHFTTPERFEEMVRESEFLEWANVFGNYYGTARHTLRDAEAQGKDLLLDIDVQGARQVREAVPDAVSVFVMPPDPDTLALRLRNRSIAEGSLSEETIQKRLAKAKDEIGNYHQYRYILVNDVLDRAVMELASIVDAERAARLTKYTHNQQARLIAASCLVRNAGERLHPVLKSFGLVATEALQV